MKRAILAVVATAAILLAGTSPALGGQPDNLHCPDGGVKVEANDGTQSEINDLVLAAGTQFCVKAGPGNTGVLVADGETTLRGYAPDGKDVSYYVIYQEVTPSATPSPSASSTPEPTPSSSPSASPTPPAPSSTPSTEPSSEPTFEPSGPPTPTTGATLPPTDTAESTTDQSPLSNPLSVYMIAVGSILIGFAVMATVLGMNQRR